MAIWAITVSFFCSVFNNCESCMPLVNSSFFFRSSCKSCSACFLFVSDISSSNLYLLWMRRWIFRSDVNEALTSTSCFTLRLESSRYLLVCSRSPCFSYHVNSTKSISHWVRGARIESDEPDSSFLDHLSNNCLRFAQIFFGYWMSTMVSYQNLLCLQLSIHTSNLCIRLIQCNSDRSLVIFHFLEI